MTIICPSAELSSTTSWNSSQLSTCADNCNIIFYLFLQVDYSAHIAHRFLLETGNSRNQRIQTALQNIGPAVANGGITTTLAFILLAGSKSHVFSTFFKIFFLVVTFGLFHGLATLPVLLAIFGSNTTHTGQLIKGYCQ